MADQPVTYVKFSAGSGQVIERLAVTAADHVQLRGTGWVEKDSTAGKRVINPKKTDDMTGVSATAITAHQAAAVSGASDAKPSTAVAKDK